MELIIVVVFVLLIFFLFDKLDLLPRDEKIAEDLADKDRTPYDRLTRAKKEAIANGDSEFELDGEKHELTLVDKMLFNEEKSKKLQALYEKSKHIIESGLSIEQLAALEDEEYKEIIKNTRTSLIKKKKKKKKSQTKEVKLYHDNGKLRTEATLDSNGKPHGNCKEWHPNGNIYKDQNYKHGVPHGSNKAYFENGNIWQDYNFKNGQPHGIHNEFYEDGSRNIISTFKDGKEHGMREQYYPSGNLETRTMYVDGMIEGVHIYLKEDGEVIEERIMENGLDITMELMQLMMGNDGEHMLKSGFLKEGSQEFEPGQIFQLLYDYYKSNDLRVESAQVSLLNQLYKEGKITKEFYDIRMSALGQK